MNTTLVFFRKWSHHTFKLCENLWRQNIPPELEGLEKLVDAVALMPAYDLFDVFDGRFPNS